MIAVIPTTSSPEEIKEAQEERRQLNKQQAKLKMQAASLSQAKEWWTVRDWDEDERHATIDYPIHRLRL
jgi:hypothetical protein